jgi:hypothetical protein
VPGVPTHAADGFPADGCTGGRGVAAGQSFEWPELEDAEAELDLQVAVADYLTQPESDADQVRA